MEENKISIAEIANLRLHAEMERQTRRRMRNYVELAKRNELSARGQVELIKHGEKDEIMSLLQAYAGDEAKEKMSAAAQLYLYEKGDVGDNAEMYRFLLEKVPYTDEFTKRLIEDNLFCSPSERCGVLRELSPEMQCYFLEYKLTHEACQGSSAVRYVFRVFDSIARYFSKYDLCEKAEVYMLQKCLKPEPSRDSFMDGCYKLAEKYITCKRKLSLAGEMILIASGKHELILKYIKIAENGLMAEDALLARGNREEVTAYFERYATL